MCICLSNMKKEREVWTDFSSQTRGNAVETFPLSRWVNDEEGFAQLRDHSHCKSRPNHTHIYKTKEVCMCVLYQRFVPLVSLEVFQSLLNCRGTSHTYLTHVRTSMIWNEAKFIRSKVAKWQTFYHVRTAEQRLTSSVLQCLMKEFLSLQVKIG